MEFEILGWPGAGVTLDLDHRRFSYAGKFVMSRSGKAAVRREDEVIAAASFSEDRTDPASMWIRYLTVRRDYRGAGIGPRLAVALRDRFSRRGYDVVRIGVNNPYAFEAMSRADFGFTGSTTGLAELVLSTADPVKGGYLDAMSRFAERESLEPEEREFVAACRERGPPARIAPPIDWGTVQPSP